MDHAHSEGKGMSGAAVVDTDLASDPKLCAVVVTYFPSDALQDRLGKIVRFVDSLVIIDNSASSAVTSRLTDFATQLGAHLISNPHNLGIATALNQGVAFARAQEAAWVIFFDQDSDPIGDFRLALNAVCSRYDSAKPLGILGCNYLAGTMPQAPTQSPDGRNYIPTVGVNTSGSAYAMAMLSKIGPFKDEYFIDCVDIEYCWRAAANGYAVCVTTQPLLRHSLGMPTHPVVLGRRMTISNHASFRRYFIARNTILLVREYFTRFPRASLQQLGYVVKSTVKICAFEDGKRKKLSFLFRGLWHGLVGRVDPEPWKLTK